MSYLLLVQCLPDSLLLVVLVGVRCVQGGVAVTPGLPESFTMVSYLISRYYHSTVNTPLRASEYQVLARITGLGDKCSE